MVKHKIFIGLILFEFFILLLLIQNRTMSVRSLQSEVAANKQMVSHFMFTDLALWSEARYTRHPSQTDLFSPFQDFPGAMEHFPSGSIIAPPEIMFAGGLE